MHKQNKRGKNAQAARKQNRQVERTARRAWMESLEDRRMLNDSGWVCSAQWPQVGQPVTYTTMFNGSGLVNFYKDGALVSQSWITDGLASFTTSFAQPGSYELSAEFTPAGIGSPSSRSMTEDVQNSVVDLLVVYTPKLNYWARDARDIATESVQRLNQALRNSRVGARVRLVGMEQINYVESGSLHTDLDALASNSDVQWLRRRFGADMVALYVNSGDAAGLAYQMTNLQDENNASRAYAVVVAGQDAMQDHLVLAHELGHIFGAAHDKANAGAPGVFSYSYGWRGTDSYGTQYRDIMAYAPGYQAPYFSNPDVTYNGWVTGTPSANTALTITRTAPTVMAYQRTALPYNLGTTMTVRATVSPTETGITLSAALSPGSSLVSLSGGVAFKDGFGRRLGASSLDPATNVATLQYVPSNPADPLGNIRAIYLGDQFSGGVVSTVSWVDWSVPVPVLSGGVLTVRGKPYWDDTISLATANGMLYVSVDGVGSEFNLAEVQKVKILAGKGNDLVWVGAGVPGCTINGGAGHDTLAGGEGADVIRGGAGNNRLYGSGGDDRLICVGADDAFGGPGSDTLEASDQHRGLLSGGGGDDTLTAVAYYGGCYLYGGAGNDTLFSQNGHQDLIDGGDGTDILHHDVWDEWSGVENV